MTEITSEQISLLANNAYAEVYDKLYCLRREETKSENCVLWDEDWFDAVDGFCAKHGKNIDTDKLLRLIQLRDHIYHLREAKILQMARIKARFNGLINTGTLLEYENEMLRELVNTLSKTKKAVCEVRQ